MGGRVLLDYASAHRIPIKPTILAMCCSVVFGWAFLIVTVAVLIFTSQRPDPVLGYGGAFFVVSLTLSILYLVNFALINCLGYLLFGIYVAHLKPWRQATVGSLLYLLSVPLWHLVGGDGDSYAAWAVESCVALAVGFVSVLILAIVSFSSERETGT